MIGNQSKLFMFAYEVLEFIKDLILF